MSGDPLDLDAAESLAREIADSPWLTVEDLDDLREVARSALALVAEVRRLRGERVGYSEKTMRRAIKATDPDKFPHPLPSKLGGGAYRIKAADLDAWVDSLPDG